MFVPAGSPHTYWVTAQPTRYRLDRLIARPRGLSDRSELRAPLAEFDTALGQAELDAVAEGVAGPELTPFLLSRLVELTVGKTLAANRALIVNNARLAALVAGELCS